MSESPRSFDEVLRDVLEQGLKGTEFQASRFFRDWFRVHGSAFYFLFKKNLTVTNLQHAELIALLRLHTKEGARIPGDELQFQNPEQFTATLNNIVNCFSGQPADIVSTLVDQYRRLFQRTVVVRPLFGSAAVFLPYGLELDLAAMCAYSGYIHSAGALVYLRRVDKAAKSDLRDALSSHLARTVQEGKKLYFVAYAHEDFDEIDVPYQADLRHGLDDTKIYVQKFYLESSPLVSVLDEIAAELHEHLVLAPPGQPEIARKKYTEEAYAVRDRTLWLMVDHAVSNTPRTRGDHRYFICYDQQFKNETPLHLFDEDKPAWTAPITIPHTMLGAMLNLTRPHWPQKGVVKIADPFVGTGTSVLEALKFKKSEAKRS